MNGLMMQRPLLISSLLVHAERHHGEQEIVSRRVEGDIHRTTYRELAARSRRMANALAGLGVKSGDRVATLAWNGYRHLELYYAVSGSGAVLHTLNPRLHPDQVVYIADHAEDQVLFFDLTFLPLVEAIADRVKTIKHFVAMTDRAHMPAGEQDPEPALLRGPASRPNERRLRLAELRREPRRRRSATPRGPPATRRASLYSHRSTVLHTFAIALPDSLNCSAARRDPAGRADVPRQRLGPAVRRLHDRRRSSSSPAPASTASRSTSCSRASGVTLSAGVPTVWQGLLAYVDANDLGSRPCAAPSSAARPARRR